MTAASAKAATTAKEVSSISFPDFIRLSIDVIRLLVNGGHLLVDGGLDVIRLLVNGGHLLVEAFRVNVDASIGRVNAHRQGCDLL